MGEARRRSFSGVGGPNALFLVEAKLVAQVFERAAQRLHAHTFLRVHLVLLGPRVVPHGHRGPAPGRDRVLKTMTSGQMGARYSRLRLEGRRGECVTRCSVFTALFINNP